MARPKSLEDAALLSAALEGLELQKQRIEQQIQQVRAMLGKRGASLDGIETSEVMERPVRKRDLSPAARKRIAVAQRKRWEEYRRVKGSEVVNEAAAEA